METDYYHYRALDVALPVTVDDDDDAGVSVSEASALSVAEGGSSTYTVVLDALPSGNVVIGVTASGSPDVTVDRATLTFTSSNWSTAQTVTVRAAHDPDAANDAAAITHAVDASRSANEYVNLDIDGVRVTVDDDETVGISVSETALPVAEGGQRNLHRGLGRLAPGGRGCCGDHGEQRQPGRDGGPGHAGLQPVQLGHGPDGDGVRRPGRRRGERRGLHHPRRRRLPVDANRRVRLPWPSMPG